MVERGHSESEKLLILIGVKSDALRDLSRQIEESGMRSIVLESTDGLSDSLSSGTYGVVVVRPSYVQAKKARRFLADRGGRVAQVPLIFVVHPADLDGPDLLAKADDFLLEPVGMEELLARIESQFLRKSLGDRVMRFDELSIDLDSYQVSLGNRPVDLTPKEFEVLRLLASSPGKVFTRYELLLDVWGADYLGGTRTVDVHIRRIRAKVETFRSYIETVHGVGYKFLE